MRSELQMDLGDLGGGCRRRPRKGRRPPLMAILALPDDYGIDKAQAVAEYEAIQRRAMTALAERVGGQPSVVSGCSVP